VTCGAVAGRSAVAQQSAVVCGRREEGEPRSVEGGGIPVGRSVGVDAQVC
jgi:hypothetical protein